MFTALVLDKESKQKLIKRFIHIIPSEWDIIAHHMTINMGTIDKGPVDHSLLGTAAELTVVSVASNDQVLAVGVISNIPSKNIKKHVTIAVNRPAGGKPSHSKHLAVWENLTEHIDLFGTIQEVGK